MTLELKNASGVLDAEYIIAVDVDIVGTYTMIEQQNHLCKLSEEIRELTKATAIGIVEIGNRLLEARSILKVNHRWRSWLDAEFAWSYQTAYNFMRVAEAADRNPQILEFHSPSVLYLVSGAPDSAVEELANRRVGFTEAKAVIERHEWLERIRELPPGEAMYEIDCALKDPRLREAAVIALEERKEEFASLSGQDAAEIVAERTTIEERYPVPNGVSNAKLVETDDGVSLVVWGSDPVTIAVFPRQEDPWAAAWRNAAIRGAAEAVGC